MTRRDRRLALAVAALAIAMLLAACAIAALLWATLDAGERETVWPVLQTRLALVLLAGLVVLAGAGFLLRSLFDRYVSAPAELLEQVQVLAASDLQRDLEPRGSAENRDLAKTIGALLRERAQLRDEMARKVAEASQEVEQERSRLAALMSELTQSVVVCNLDGRILLYNGRARMQFRALSIAPAVAGGTELIGLGRSIYAVFDRRLIAHALESIQLRLQRGAVSPSTQFVTTTRTGSLLRVQMAAVLDPADAASGAGAPGGFVLVIDNVTREVEQDSLRDQLLHQLTEGNRASLASLQAAVEMLDFPDLEPAMRERFHGVIRDEVAALGDRLRGVAADTARFQTRWPLDDMLGADLLAAGARRIESAHAVRVGAAEVDPELWLRVDSFSLLQALTYLAGRLQEDLTVKVLRLRLLRAGQHAQLDIVWAGAVPSSEAASGWEAEPMGSRSGPDGTPLTVRDVVERHGGEFWFERARSGDEVFFRFLLPVAEDRDEPEAEQAAMRESRPEYYDFDLFRTSPRTRLLDDRDLADLSYTVFDTETTGLDPTGGDEIIQIGATRILNGRLLKSESFLQLVDPQRPISQASKQIHGIGRESLRGQPTIAEVLPSFHAFASETVLVAHNAAFDMRFLELKQDATGVRFDQPVLDTLLLSAIVHPDQDSHSLEAIAARLDVPVAERHSALGDALVTAAVFLRLVPLLRNRGIRTLGQARAAAQETYHARLRY